MIPSLSVGDLLAVPVANGRIGLAQVLEIEPQIWVAVMRYEADGPPSPSAITKLKILQDPGGLTGAVHNLLRDEAPCPFEVVGNAPAATERRFASPNAWTWERLPAEVYFGGNSGLDLEGDDLITEIVRSQGQEGARKTLDRIYRSSAGKTKPKPKLLPKADYTLPASFELSDDDNVVIFASARALERRYAAQPYDYTYPNALLEGMNAGELAAASHEHSQIALGLAAGPAHDHRRARICGRVEIGEGDQLLAIPHAPFTRACDTHDGEADKLVDEPYARVELPPGVYEVSVLRVRGHRFSVRLAEIDGAASVERRSFEHVPKL